jgi:hypothetical protein
MSSRSSQPIELFDPPRVMTEDERAIVAALLDAAGFDKARFQDLGGRIVHGQYRANDPSIIFTSPPDTAMQPRLTLDGTLRDRQDDGEVQVSLHVVGRRILDELEFFRFDGKPVYGTPSPDTFVPAPWLPRLRDAGSDG